MIEQELSRFLCGLFPDGWIIAFKKLGLNIWTWIIQCILHSIYWFECPRAFSNTLSPNSALTCVCGIVWGNIKIYWHLLSYLDIEMVQVVEKVLCRTQGYICPTESVSWLLMIWGCTGANIFFTGANIFLFPQTIRPWMVWLTFCRRLLLNDFRCTYKKMIRISRCDPGGGGWVGLGWWCSIINSLWLGKAMWHDRSWSPLVQVMAWCLTAPTCFQNQCRIIVKGTLMNHIQ